ncbi:uncharacterized protein HHUB_1079 [Halobacterium hubeiense]|uniref:Uncharacterized protein n=2 Tax=Halobacterium TaxID=2239 RepID=A0A0U5GZI5_9EURY|nr:hypothetical protein [Halobacterium hubeiense]CQH44786.1 uncharacterized protein HHUB_1079 [Halobacterium hubeiense]
MRTLPVVLAVVVVNDAALLLALDVSVPAWLGVLGAALALTALVAAAVSVGVERETPTNAELQREIEALRERVAALEDRERRGND